MSERSGNNGDQTDFATDGSVDLRRNPVRRSERGGWKACSFLLAYELIERMAYYSIQSNLVSYLTNKLHQGTVEAANNVTNWVGTAYLTPILGAYIADAYLGQYWTFVIGSAIYLLGMTILTVAVSVPNFRPPPCIAGTCQKASTQQLAVFFIGLYTIALANGGTKPNVTTFGANQFDETCAKEKAQKHSFFNWWMVSIFLGTLFSPTVLVYLQDNISFSVGYGVPTIALLVSVVIFLAGTPFYRHKMSQGSPVKKMARVIVGSVRNWRLSVPNDGDSLQTDGGFLERNSTIQPTNSMRFLDKAAIATNSITNGPSCSSTDIEETKQMISMLPILVTLILPCTMIAQVNTLFVKQGATLDRHMGPGFQIPPASLGVFVTITMLISVVLYDRYFIKVVRKWTNNPRGITILQRIGTGMFLQVVTMLFASVIENKRLSIVKRENNNHTSLSIFFLLPQFVFMGFADSFLVVGQTEFFYDQAPDSMKSLGSSYTLTAYGIGNFLSSFLLKLVSDITKKKGKGWVLNDLNSSRLDYYYAFLTVLNALNFVFFLFVCKMFKYRVEFCSSAERKDEAEKDGNLDFTV